jgi:segregation and condensation protein B
LFGTTRAFLDYFNLKSLDELPPLSEIRDMEDPQMSIAPEPLPARVVRDLPIDPEADEAEDIASDTSTHETPDSPHTESAEVGTDHTPTSHQEHPQATEVAANDEPGAAPHADTTNNTADEAATHATADEGAATQDTEEYRA